MKSLFRALLAVVTLTVSAFSFATAGTNSSNCVYADNGDGTYSVVCW